MKRRMGERGKGRKGEREKEIGMGKKENRDEISFASLALKII